MKLLLIALGFAVISSTSQAAGGNPFKPKPKPRPVVTAPQHAPQINSGMSQDEVIALFEQRLALIAEESGGLLLGDKGALRDEVVTNTDFLGLVNKQYVYKDKKKGCYIYEDATSGEMVESRCYGDLLKRLRNTAGESAASK